MVPDSDSLAGRLEVARAIAREAGDLTLDYFRKTDLQVETKQDDTPVTVADRRAEQLLRRRIVAAFPGDQIVGEEFGETPGSSGYCWVLDPIDGTQSFISGVPLYGTLVGVQHGGKSAIGVIYMPALGECAYAAAGQGAWLELADAPSCRPQVSAIPDLSDGLFCTTEVALFDGRGRRDVFEQLQRAARLSRTWGDCYGPAGREAYWTTRSTSSFAGGLPRRVSCWSVLPIRSSGSSRAPTPIRHFR